jgi:S-adenosylmethionine:tRNA-ribosyltransferase-isomerase (queuine synthetase)
VEALVERVLPGHEVLAHLRASKSPRPGSLVRFGRAFDAEVLGRGGPDGSLFHLRFPADPLVLLERHGHVPLPPYITHADTPTTNSATRPCSPPARRRGRAHRGAALRRTVLAALQPAACSARA